MVFKHAALLCFRRYCADLKLSSWEYFMKHDEYVILENIQYDARITYE